MKTKTLLAILMPILLPLQVITFNAAFASTAISMPNQYHPSASTQSTPYPSVELKWIPDKPSSGQEVTFTVSFKKPDKGSLQPHIDYKLVIVKDGKDVFTVTKHTDTGSDTIKQKLATDGKYIVTVTITGVNFKKVDPKSSDFSLVVAKTQAKTQQQTPQMQQQKQTQQNKSTMPKVKEERKGPMTASLTDEKGNRLGVVKVVQEGPNTIITVSLRPVGLTGHISAWLVAGPKEQVTKNNWSKLGDMSAIQIGQSKEVKRMNIFHQKLSFVPASGDMIVIATDDCSAGHCKPTTNHIATAKLK